MAGARRARVSRRRRAKAARVAVSRMPWGAIYRARELGPRRACPEGAMRRVRIGLGWKILLEHERGAKPVRRVHGADCEDPRARQVG